MTIDAGLKPEGAPERSPIAGAGAPSSVDAGAKRYNETWLVARHGYKTPARVREEQTMPRIAIDPTLAATLPLAA